MTHRQSLIDDCRQDLSLCEFCCLDHLVWHHMVLQDLHSINECRSIALIIRLRMQSLYFDS